MTQSYVKLTISPAAYDEIRRLLEVGGYKHAIMKSGTLDMFGFGLARAIEPLPTKIKFAPVMPGPKISSEPAALP